MILARVYPGRHEEAVELFQQDAEILAEHGYFPIAQSYAEGHYSSAWILLTTIPIFFGIGILLLLYMAAVRPPGTLAATFELRGAMPPTLR